MVPSRRAGRGWIIAILAVCFVALVASHACLIGYGAFANVDEAYAAALGGRIVEGHRLYEGAISQRGPLMYYAFALIAKIAGWDNIVGIRLAALGLAMAHIAVVYWAAKRVISTRAALLASTLTTYILVVGLPGMDGLAINAEPLQIPVLVVGATLTVLATRARGGSRRLLFASGVLFGVAIATKHSAMLQPVPSVLWILAESRRRAPRTLPFASLGVFLAGIVVVPLIFVVHAASNGSLGSMIYYTVSYNLHVHLKPSDTLLSSASLVPLTVESRSAASFMSATLAATGAAVIFLVRRAKDVRRTRSIWALGRGFDVRAYFTLHFLAGAASASAMYRFFPHYFMPAIPFMVLAVSSFVTKRLRHVRVDIVRIATAILAATTLVLGGLITYYYEKIDGRVAHDVAPQVVGRYIEATTAPQSKIFVWGFSPWVYEYSHRRPAGRYVFETYVTGFVPWFYNALPKEPSRVVPGALDALLGDLDREDPEVVVDAGSIMIARSMRAYPASNKWLHDKYCFEVRLGAFDIYRKKNGECRATAFPYLHVPVDFWGNALPTAPVPLPLDQATSRSVCQATLSSPAWFPDAPPARLDLLKTVKDEAPPGAAMPEQLAPPMKCDDQR